MFYMYCHASDLRKLMTNFDKFFIFSNFIGVVLELVGGKAGNSFFFPCYFFYSSKFHYELWAMGGREYKKHIIPWNVWYKLPSFLLFIVREIYRRNDGKYYSTASQT